MELWEEEAGGVEQAVSALRTREEERRTAAARRGKRTLNMRETSKDGIRMWMSLPGAVWVAGHEEGK